MTEVFLLKNQHGNFLEKSGEWVNPTQSKSLYRTLHKDEAINQKVELAVKNADLRVEITTGQVGPEGKLILQHCDIPLEMPAADIAAAAEEASSLDREMSQSDSEQTAEQEQAEPDLFSQPTTSQDAETASTELHSIDSNTVESSTDSSEENNEEQRENSEQSSLFSA